MMLMTLVQALVLLPVVSAAQCVDDGECRTSGAECCSGRQRTEATCGYIGPGTIDCMPVCENVTALVLQKLGNVSDCAAIRKQEGIDAGVGRGICDILYQGEEPCVGLLPQLLSKTCAMAEANRSLSSLQLCIESDACGTGMQCGCLKDGQCLGPGADRSDCCHGSFSTTACHYGHERKGWMCGAEPSVYKCIDNQCQASPSGVSLSKCRQICGSG